MTMPMKQVISGAFDSLSHSMETYMGSPREVNLSDEINEATQRCFWNADKKNHFFEEANNPWIQKGRKSQMAFPALLFLAFATLIFHFLILSN